MAVKSVVTKGWLLQRIPLANDDCLLTFLTEDYGKLNVFASKLQRSKKKAAELDYFRWLELELSQPKQSFKLKGVKALTDFSPYLADYKRMQFGFDVLKESAKFCPEGEANRDMVQLLHETWTLKDLPLVTVEVFFYIKLLWNCGVLPRFDSVRSALWVHPLTLVFTTESQVGACGLTNHQRQMLEWFRRVQAIDLADKHNQFELEDLKILQSFLKQVLQNH